MGRSKEQISKNMRRIKGKDTKIEILLRQALWRKGYRYRKNYKALPGKPDIVMTKQRIVVFCDSEFFHGKDWNLLIPQLTALENGAFWINKITRNMKRDLEVNLALRTLGWTVLRFWGKDIKKDSDACVRAIEEAIFDNKIQLYEGETTDVQID